MKKILLLSCAALLFPTSQALLSFQPVLAQTSVVQQVTPPNSPATPTSTPTSSPVSNSINATTTKLDLLNSGTGDKKQLRFTPTTDSRQTSILTLKLDLGDSSSVGIPATKLTMEIVVTQIDPNGDIHFNFTYKNVDLVAAPGTATEVINALRPSLTPLVGLNGSIVVDSRGLTKNTNITLPQELDPTTQQIFEQLSSSLGQLYAPLPEEAVGKGAQWRVTQELNVNGIQLTQSAIYELVSNQDNVLQLKVLVEQEAPPQEIKLPASAGIPVGFSVQLRSLSSQGEGEMTLGLGQMLPRRSILSSRSSVVLSFKPTGTEQGIPINQDLAVQIILDSQP